MNEFPRSMSGSGRINGLIWARAIGCLLFVLASMLLVKNANIVSPIMNWDEYAYFSQSREFPNVAGLQVYDPGSAQSNNVLYFWLGHKFWQGAIDPALTMRITQSLIYLLIAPVFYCLCRRFLSRPLSALLVIVGLTTGLSSFSGYFMPETLYTFLFVVLMAWVAYTIEKPVVAALGSGLLVSMLAMTKPHGIAIAIGVAGAWILCFLFPRLVGIARRQALLGLLAFAVALYVSLVGVGGLLTGHTQLDPLFFVGSGYTQFWTGKSRAMAPVRDIVTVLAGNGVPMALLVGMPIVYSAIGLVRVKAYAIETSERRSLFFLTLVLLCVSVMTLGMTVNFTAQIGDSEIWRIHGRYYSFLIPMYLVVMFAVAKIQVTAPYGVFSQWILRGAALLGIVVVCIIHLSWRWGFEVSPADFPEIFSLTGSQWIAGAVDLGTLMVVAGAATFALIFVWPRHAPYIFALFFLILNVTSLVQVSRWQFAHMRSFVPYTSAAAALHGLIPADSLDRGIVIGTNRSNTSFLLVGLRSRSRVITVAPNSVVDKASVGDAVWAVLDGPLDIQLPDARVVFTRGNLSFLVLREFVPFKTSK